MERAVLGGEGLFGDCDCDCDCVGVVVDGGLVVAWLLWPKSWANFTYFQIPTEELTMKVDANVVMPAMAWSILGYTLFKRVSDALAVAKVAV